MNLNNVLSEAISGKLLGKWKLLGKPYYVCVVAQKTGKAKVPLSQVMTELHFQNNPVSFIFKKYCQWHNRLKALSVLTVDSFNTFSSKQKLQQALKSWFCLTKGDKKQHKI